jgi:GxxExxY protein
VNSVPRPAGAVAMLRRDANRNKDDMSDDGALHGAITDRVLRTFFDVHLELGYGFLESVYARAMAVELTRRGVRVQRDAPLQVFYKGVVVGSFSADLLVEGKVVVAIQGGDSLSDAVRWHLLNGLRCSGLEVGLLLHFGASATFRRVVYAQRSRLWAAVLNRDPVDQGPDAARVSPG